MMKAKVQCKNIKWLRVFLLWSYCFCIGLIPFTSKAQSFSEQLGVHIKDGTTVIEYKKSDIKIHVVSGTKITGIDQANISIVNQKSIAVHKKKYFRQQVSRENEKVHTSNKSSYKRTYQPFVLKPATPGKLLLAINKSVNGAVQTNTNNYQEYQAITVAQTCLVFYKNSVKKKTLPQNKSSKGRLSINTLFVRPPPVSDFV